jgi:hypothetical protein
MSKSVERYFTVEYKRFEFANKERLNIDQASAWLVEELKVIGGNGWIAVQIVDAASTLRMMQRMMGDEDPGIDELGLRNYLDYDLLYIVIAYRQRLS